VTSTTPPARASGDAARAESLTKVYGSGETKVVALDAVSVSFPSGQFTAIMGPSGSGKSTLMHCLAGLDEATSGAVFIGDVDITTADFLLSVGRGIGDKEALPQFEQLADKLGAVLDEIPKVREDLGYPPLVTPTSQIVGTQAVMNVLAGEPYGRVTREVRQYFQGFYGHPPGPVNVEVQKKVVDPNQPVITDRPADHLEPELEKARAEIGELATSEEDVISYAIFPQVAREFLEWRANGSQPEPELAAAIAAALAVDQQRAHPNGATPAPSRSAWKLAGRQRSVRPR